MERTYQDGEAQLLAVAALREQLLALGQADLAEKHEGMVDELRWLLGHRVEAPAMLRPVYVDPAAIADELAAAGAASLQPGPAQTYALGAYEALRWWTGLRQEPLAGSVVPIL